MGCSQSSPQVASAPGRKGPAAGTKIQPELTTAIHGYQAATFPAVFVGGSNRDLGAPAEAGRQQFTVDLLEARWFGPTVGRTASNSEQPRLPPIGTPESSVFSRALDQLPRNLPANVDSDFSGRHADFAARPSGFRPDDSVTVKKILPPIRMSSAAHIFSSKKIGKSEYTICVKGDHDQLDRSGDGRSNLTPKHENQSSQSGGRVSSKLVGGFAKNKSMNRSICFDDMQEYMDRNNKFGKQLMKVKFSRNHSRKGSLNILDDIKESNNPSPVKHVKTSFNEKEQSMKISTNFVQAKQTKQIDAKAPVFERTQERRPSYHKPEPISPIIMSPLKPKSQDLGSNDENGMKKSKFSRGAATNAAVNKRSSANSSTIQARSPVLINSETLLPLRKMVSDTRGDFIQDQTISIKRIQTAEEGVSKQDELFRSEIVLNSKRSRQRDSRNNSVRLPFGQGQDIIQIVKKTKNPTSPTT